MKNKLILGLLTLFTIALSAQNYTYFENDMRFIDGETSTSVSHFGEFPITEKFGITDYFQIETGYAGEYGQGLIGLYYKLDNNLSIALFGGLESISKDIRYAFLIYYNNDRWGISAFYQRNQNPFDKASKETEWYDFQGRYELISKEKNSLYVGARYMKFYGLGVPIGVRQSLSKNLNVYIFYTTYYDIDKLFDNSWIPTVSLNMELF